MERRKTVRAHGERTRARLIEVAGQLFAERGLDRATGQEICRRAGTHPASIVYHFGGMQGLYRAVLDEAQRRLVSTETLRAAVAAQPTAARKLESFLGLIVGALASPASRSWAGRLFGREFVSPSALYGRSHDRTLRERARMLKSIVGALTGRAPQDPLVARACLSVMAPCAVMLLIDRRKLRRVFPELKLDPDNAALVTRQLVRFAMAGIAALARQSGTDSRGARAAVRSMLRN
jgi:TetR/AcrR family transcriptional regulator, regulator of cefoperazone and chloramphenicol sensitivity